MYLPDIPKCTIQKKNVQIFGALWDMGKIGLFHNSDVFEISMETKPGKDSNILQTIRQNTMQMSMIMRSECVHKLNVNVRCLVWWILTTFVTYWYMAATTEYNHDNITIKYARAFQLAPLTNQLASYGFGQIMTGKYQQGWCCCKC